MQRHITSTSLAVIATLVLVAPAAADKADCSRKLEQSYSKAYLKVSAQHGSRAAGRDLRHRGVRIFIQTRHRYVHRIEDATCHDLRRARGQLRHLLTHRTYLAYSATAPRQPPAGVKSRTARPIGLAACIVHHESGGRVDASNGTHFGIAQWTFEAWARHGGVRMWHVTDPRAATWEQQLEVLNNGLVRYGCADWCPFDPC